jgi:hypothetical protein
VGRYGNKEYCTGTPGFIGWWNRFLGIVLDFLNVYKFGHSWSVNISFKDGATGLLILLVSFMAPQNSNFQSRHFPAINSNIEPADGNIFRC